MAKSRMHITAFLALAVLIASCATGFESAPLIGPDHENAELRSTRQGGLFSETVTRLFAVDGKRVLDTNRVILEPGPHEVELALGNLAVDAVRTLRFEARSGQAYEVYSRGYSWGDNVSYWIAERDSGAIVAEGDDTELHKFRRKWYIDPWKRELGGMSAGEGFATFVRYHEEDITIAGVHDDPEYPRMWAGEYEYRDQTVPAGTWVTEIHRGCGKGCDFFGRIVAEFHAGKSYAVELEPGSFWNIGPIGAWLVNADSGERVGRFHTCRSRMGDNRPIFVDCEAAPSATVDYAGVKPGDPRFWWGPPGKED